MAQRVDRPTYFLQLAMDLQKFPNTAVQDMPSTQFLSRRVFAVSTKVLTQMFGALVVAGVATSYCMVCLALGYVEFYRK